MRQFIVRAACASLLLPLSLSLVASVAHGAAEPVRRAITHEDVWLMQRPGALAASPDGRWFVASVAEPSYEEDKRRSDLWLMPADGSSGSPRRLTSSKSSEGDPVWSPDSTRIAFSAKREDDEAEQIYVLDLGGGEAQRVTNWPGGAKAPSFSPDGRAILFAGPTHPGALTLEDNVKAAADRKARKYNARAYDSFPIRHWDRWLDELRPSLIVQPLDGNATPRDLLAGSALRKERGFGGRLGNEGDTLDAAWTPDGSGVVFAATTNRHEGARAEVIASLWHVRLDGGEPRRLTGEEGDYSSPAFTPDGAALLAKVQPTSKRWVYSTDRLVRWSWPSLGERRMITAGVAESVGQYVAAPDNRRVFFIAEQAGRDKLFQVPLDGGPPSQVGQLEVGTYTRIAVGGTAAAPTVGAIWSSAASPHEVGRVDLATGRWSALTALNSTRAAAIDLQPAEEFWFDSKRGKRIHNLLVKPPGFDPQKKYPLFVVIHGGPHISGRTTLSSAGTITCLQARATWCCSPTTAARRVSARSSRAASRATRSPGPPTRSTRQQTRPSRATSSSTASGRLRAGPATADT